MKITALSVLKCGGVEEAKLLTNASDVFHLGYFQHQLSSSSSSLSRTITKPSGQRQSAPQKAGGLSHVKESQSCLRALAASLSSISPEEDSTARSSEGFVDIDLNLPRRRLQLSFTCDACGARTQRLINPDAYTRGTVFVQCAGCEVYHKLVDNLGLIEEYDFREENESKVDGTDLTVPE